MDVVCPQTGEVRTAQLFVATLGASSYTYVEASWTQSLPDWISSHIRAFDFFGGVPAQVVSDNLKAGVTKACFYEPAINRTYADMAMHYDTAIVPARPRKPKDKAKVEGAVLLVERWILARLRNQRFFSLDELNTAIRPLMDQLNGKVTRHLGASRKDLFEALDSPALKSLPVEPYVYAEWKECRVGLDYHIDVGRHYYSVPHQLLKQKLWVRITARTIEAYFRGQRVAAHQRTSGNRQHSTHPLPGRRLRSNLPRGGTTCPQTIDSGQTGRRNAYADRPPGSARTPKPMSRSSCASDVIRNKATDPAWAFCGWPRPLAGIAWRPLVHVLSRSTPVPTHLCIPF
jgi:transposase